MTSGDPPRSLGGYGERAESPRSEVSSPKSEARSGGGDEFGRQEGRPRSEGKSSKEKGEIGTPHRGSNIEGHWLCASASLRLFSGYRAATSRRVRKRIWGLGGTKPSTETRSPNCDSPQLPTPSSHRQPSDPLRLCVSAVQLWTLDFGLWTSRRGRGSVVAEVVLGEVFDARSDSIKNPEGKGGQGEDEEESGEHGESGDGAVGNRNSGFGILFPFFRGTGRVGWGLEGDW